MTIRAVTFFLACAGLCPAASAPPPLTGRVRAIIDKSPIAHTAFWGVQVVDVQTGRALCKLNADHFFVPASNTKLFSSALALVRLGPAYRLHTTITASSAPDANGLITGDLVLNGSGDASLTTADIDAFAAQLLDRRVRRIDGDIVGDDSAFLWQPYNPGWGLDDPLGKDGAPVSALTLNDNTITLNVASTQVTFSPPVPLFNLDNQIEIDNALPRKLRLERLPGSTNLRIWGTTATSDADTTIVIAVDDPARYAALVLMDALQRKGIQVSGRAVARHLLPGTHNKPPAQTTVLAERDSAPLLDDLRVTDKTSQNLHAEILLRLVARDRTGQGSREAGLDQLKVFLDDAGIDETQYNLRDGSGMSRQNVLTPDAVATLLAYMAKSPQGENWTSLLSVGGVDGTLKMRMTSRRMKGRIIGKTGSLSHVSALSGYVQRRNRKLYAFSILVNNYNGPASDVRDVIDRICALLVD